MIVPTTAELVASGFAWMLTDAARADDAPLRVVDLCDAVHAKLQTTLAEAVRADTHRRELQQWYDDNPNA